MRILLYENQDAELSVQRQFRIIFLKVSTPLNSATNRRKTPLRARSIPIGGWAQKLAQNERSAIATQKVTYRRVKGHLSDCRR